MAAAVFQDFLERRAGVGREQPRGLPEPLPHPAAAERAGKGVCRADARAALRAAAGGALLRPRRFLFRAERFQNGGVLVHARARGRAGRNRRRLPRAGLLGLPPADSALRLLVPPRRHGEGRRVQRARRGTEAGKQSLRAQPGVFPPRILHRRKGLQPERMQTLLFYTRTMRPSRRGFAFGSGPSR